MLVADLLRHGELEGGVKYRGHVEEKLTFQGREQMNHVWEAIKAQVDVIVSSPLSRCAMPAQEWAKSASIPCVIDARMAEIDYGDWEGLSHDEIEQAFPNMLAQWRKDPTGMRPPHGESPEELRQRVAEFWCDMTKKYQHQHILIVAHSGSLRMLIAYLNAQPIAYTRAIEMPYACWRRVEYDEQAGVKIFKEPLNKSDMAATLALRDEM